MELKVDSEKVKQAAESCPTAATVLRTLFPEAFIPEEPLYKRLGFRPGTRWKHKTDPKVTYIYLGDSPALGAALDRKGNTPRFYSLNCYFHGFVWTSANASDLEVIEL